MLRNLQFTWPCEFFPVSQETSKMEVINNYCVVGSVFMHVYMCANNQRIKKSTTFVRWDTL